MSLVLRKATLLALPFLLSLASTGQALALVSPTPSLTAKNASALIAALISAHDYKYRDAYLKAKGSFLGGGKETQVTTRSTQVIRSALQARNVSTTSNTLQLVGSQINAEVADIKAETLKLVSDKNSDYRRVYEDSSGLITRTVEDEGYQRETAVPSTIAAAKLIFNGDELKRAAAVDELVTTLSSEHDLSPAQVETLKAQLNNQEWHHKTTTLSKLGAIIVQAVALAVAPGVADAALSGITNALLKTATRAAINSLSGQLTRQALTVAVTGGGAGFDLGGIVEGAIKAGLTAGLGFEADSLIATANLGEIGGHLGTIVTDAAIQSAVYGGNLADNILNAAIDDVSSFDAHKIGDMTDSATLTNIIAHAALGCGVGAALASDCAAGAAGAALSAVFAPQIAKGVDADGDGKNLSLDEKKQVRSLTQIVSALVAHAAGQNLDVSNYTTLNEVENNYLSHTEAKRLKQLERELFDCNFAGNDCNAIVAEKTALEALDRQRDKDLRDACSSKGSAAACARERDKALEAFASYGDPQGIGSDVDGHKRHVELILASTDKAQAILATAVLGPVAGAAIVSAGTAAVQACLLNPAGCIGILEAAAAEFTGGVAVGVLAKKAATRAGKAVTKRGVNALDVVPSKYRGAVSQSFRGDPELVELTEPLVVYRHWGGKASEVGSPWFSPKPYAKPGDAQRHLALPKANTAQNVTAFKIPAGTSVLRGKVASQAGEAGFDGKAVGGGIQIYVPDPRVAVPLQ